MKTSFLGLRSLLIFCSLILICNMTIAEDEVDAVEGESGESAPQSAIYIPLKPEFVVNFGGAGKLKYLKANVTLRLGNSDAANSVRHHLPYIRNNLVMLFTAQTTETLESQDGREAMRTTALSEIRELLTREDELAPEAIVDVLFNSLTWH